MASDLEEEDVGMTMLELLQVQELSKNLLHPTLMKVLQQELEQELQLTEDLIFVERILPRSHSAVVVSRHIFVTNRR